MQNYDIILFSTYDEQVATQKALARQNPTSCLGTTFATFRSYVSSLWDLYGDERSIIGNVQRKLLVQKACEGRESSPTAVEALVAKADAAPYLLAACENPESLEISDPEEETIRTCAVYFNLLANHGLVEFGHAVLHLKETLPQKTAQKQVLLWGTCLPEDEAPLLLADNKLGIVTFQSLADPETLRITRPEGITPRFTFSSGPYAAPAALQKAISAIANQEEASAGELGEPSDPREAERPGEPGDLRKPSESAPKRIAVTCADPLHYFTLLQNPLLGQGITPAVQGKVPFTQIEMGRFLAQVCIMALDEAWDPLLASQVAHCVHSKISPKDARNIDRVIRSDRLFTCQRALSLVTEASPTVAKLVDLMQGTGNKIVFRSLRMALRRSPHSLCWKVMQERCLDAFGTFIDACRQFGMNPADCLDILTSAKVNVSVQALPNEQKVGDGADAQCGDADNPCETNAAATSATTAGPSVVFFSQSQAALEQPGSFDALIMADLSQSNCPISAKKDAMTLLLEKLGCLRTDQTLAKARLTTNKLTTLPTQQLVLHRSLNDANAEEDNPALIFEELLDCYRDDPTDTADIDNPYRIPERLMAGMITVGEEDFHLTTTYTQSLPDDLEVQPVANDTALPDPRHLILPRRTEEGPLPGIILSPSKINDYALCPHHWFIGQRLKIDPVDEVIDGPSKGSFIHELLQRFYPAYSQLTGEKKLTKEHLPEAKRLICDLGTQLAAEQKDRSPRDNRLVTLNPTEEHLVQGLIHDAADYLERECQLLPTFMPTYFEYSIPPEDAVEYGGVKITGAVDRIDVDDQGRAVIIDYKGTLRPEHALSSFLAGTGNCQALIYAGAIQRRLGLQVVGALYVSYKRKGGISGAYDGIVLEPLHLPGIVKGCASMPGDESGGFTNLLASTEEMVEELARRMQSGDVHPQKSAACEYCLRTNCPERN